MCELVLAEVDALAELPRLDKHEEDERADEDDAPLRTNMDGESTDQPSNRRRMTHLPADGRVQEHLVVDDRDVDDRERRDEAQHDRLCQDNHEQPSSE